VGDTGEGKESPVHYQEVLEVSAAKRTLARHAATCKRCGDPVEQGMAIRMWGGSWAHCYCQSPWLEGKGPLAHRTKPHPQWRREV
jgi:hypothetical protein